MNKNLMMTAALLAACLGMNAQQKVGTWSVQPKVGLNVAKLTAVDNASFKVKSQQASAILRKVFVKLSHRRRKL